jgi:hypothetical protein
VLACLPSNLSGHSYFFSRLRDIAGKDKPTSRLLLVNVPSAISISSLPHFTKVDRFFS